eukprot:15140560-Heterocapsa_arctica.AAC.1
MLHNSRIDRTASLAHLDAATIYNHLRPSTAQYAESSPRAFPTTTSTSVIIFFDLCDFLLGSAGYGRAEQEVSISVGPVQSEDMSGACHHHV